MLEALIPLGSTIFGAIGAIFKQREERKAKQMELDNGLKHREYDMQELTMEIEHKAKVVEAEATRDMELSADRNMQASYTSVKPWFEGEQPWWLKLVDALRSLMRPFITFYLLVATSYITYHVHVLVDGLGIMSSAELVELYSNLIMAAISLTMTAVGWWFGSRPTQSR